MNQRRILSLAMAMISVVALVAVGVVFIESMSPSARAINNASVVIELEEFEVGKVVIKEVKGKRIYFLRPDSNQTESIERLSGHVWDKSLSNYDPGLEAYVYWGLSTKWGCDLDHKPPQESMIKEWVENAEWLGGYWDQWCEVSYDYAGRAIKSYPYTFNGYNQEFPNLDKPAIKAVPGRKIIVSMIKR